MPEKGRYGGIFVICEGGLGCGKTTQARMISDTFRFAHFREPGGTPFGEKIRDAVQGMYDYKVHPYASLLAYAASRANLIRGVVIPELRCGRRVLLERYWYSTWAYQGAEGVSKPIIWAVNVLATANLVPTAILHYDLLPEIGMQRKNACADIDRYDAKKLEFHRRVRANYRQLGRLFPGRWVVIDASKSVEDVYADSLQALAQFGIHPR